MNPMRTVSASVFSLLLVAGAPWAIAQDDAETETEAEEVC